MEQDLMKIETPSGMRYLKLLLPLCNRGVDLTTSSPRTFPHRLLTGKPDNRKGQIC